MGKAKKVISSTVMVEEVSFIGTDEELCPKQRLLLMVLLRHIIKGDGVVKLGWDKKSDYDLLGLLWETNLRVCLYPSYDSKYKIPSRSNKTQDKTDSSQRDRTLLEGCDLLLIALESGVSDIEESKLQWCYQEARGKGVRTLVLFPDGSMDYKE